VTQFAKNLPYDPVRDLMPGRSDGEHVQYSRRAPSVPVKSVAELIAFAKRHPAS